MFFFETVGYIIEDFIYVVMYIIFMLGFCVFFFKIWIDVFGLLVKDVSIFFYILLIEDYFVVRILVLYK